MATKADIPQAYKDMVKEQKIVTKFREFSDVTAPKEKKGKAPLTGTNSKKICADCWEKPSSSPFKSLKMGELVDASVFPKVTDKSKGGMEITVDKCAEYMARLSLKVVDKNKENEIGKTKDKAKADQLKAERKGLAFDTPEVIETAKTLCGCVTSPEITGTKQSATGNVGGLTDTSKYTGAHKERFDASGKGKGIEGRVEKANTSGYVGNYKEAGTYDKKH